VTFSGIEETEVELGSGDFQFVRIAGGKHEFAGLFLSVGIAYISP
jgi:hypothetical protein